MSQILNLKCHELDQVAQFMGHDVRVHREFYRLPHDVVQTARVVKVLMAMENGTISQYRGKSLMYPMTLVSLFCHCAPIRLLWSANTL